jgi:hypothetical protein
VAAAAAAVKTNRIKAKPDPSLLPCLLRLLPGGTNLEDTEAFLSFLFSSSTTNSAPTLSGLTHSLENRAKNIPRKNLPHFFCSEKEV